MKELLEETPRYWIAVVHKGFSNHTAEQKI